MQRLMLYEREAKEANDALVCYCKMDCGIQLGVYLVDSVEHTI